MAAAEEEAEGVGRGLPCPLLSPPSVVLFVVAMILMHDFLYYGDASSCWDGI